jgi:serine/threonine protein kinase
MEVRIAPKKSPAMPPPTTVEEFLTLLRKSNVMDEARLTAYLDQVRSKGGMPTEPKPLAKLLVRDALLTYFQAEQLMLGRWRGFTIGKYRLLERLGFGGMGVVYLGEHFIMRRRVAIKVLPLSLAEDPWFLQQFHREAQLVAALDHPNIVRAHDIDTEGKLHYLVMEYVDGSSFHEIVTQHGPMDVVRAAHYIRQAAEGLQHAYEIGMVHRDIKPANILLSRQGVVKILDMGLACFSRNNRPEWANGSNDDRRMVGTDDYLAPEQIVNSDDVDIRADIYSLGATFYFLLTGKPPFHEAAHESHKLIWHLTRRPKPIRSLRADVPEGLEAVIDKMLAKNPWDRCAFPMGVSEALAPWTTEPIAPPPVAEMPCLSPALRPPPTADGKPSSATRFSTGGRSWVLCGPTPGTVPSSSILSQPGRTQAQQTTTSTQVNPPGPTPAPASPAPVAGNKPVKAS